jgi:hypothetical protein
MIDDMVRRIDAAVEEARPERRFCVGALILALTTVALVLFIAEPPSSGTVRYDLPVRVFTSSSPVASSLLARLSASCWRPCST